MKKVTVGLALALLAGCTATTADLAKSGDWHQIGYQDGITGHTSRTMSELRELGSVKQSDYDQGYLEGLREYCNPAFAYQMGYLVSITKGFVKVLSKRKNSAWNGNVVGMNTQINSQ